MASGSSRSLLSTALRPIASSSKQAIVPNVRRSSNFTTHPSPSKDDSSKPIILSFPPVKPLPRPHNIHVATLHLAAYEIYPLDLYSSFALHTANSMGIPTSNIASLPTRKSLYTVPKSPFVHKKAQENFEQKTHKRVIKVWDTDVGVIDLWLRYLKRNGIGGVGMKAYIHEWEEIGFGKKEMESLEEQFDGLGQGESVQQVAERLLSDLQGFSTDQTSEGVSDSSGQVEKQGGKDLVEGSDDFVAGQDLSTAKPKKEAEEHTQTEADGGSRGPNHP